MKNKKVILTLGIVLLSGLFATQGAAAPAQVNLERTEIFSFAPGAFPIAVAIDKNGDVIVSERDSNKLSRVTRAGVRTEIFSFVPGTQPHQVAIDGNGDIIVAERTALSRISQDGVRTKIYSFPAGVVPRGVAIDGNGDFIVVETHPVGKLVRISPAGVRTEIFVFPGGTQAYPHYVSIDSTGDFIVPATNANVGPGKLWRITPAGAGTVFYTFPPGRFATNMVIDSEGNFIVPAFGKIFRITPGGAAAEIFTFPAGTAGWTIALDSRGGFIVAELNPDKLSRIAPAVREVQIDIKPGSIPNSVKPGSKGVVPVAILTTSTFDATTVDPLSVVFGPGEARETHGWGHIEDVDGDFDFDLVLHVNAFDTGIECGDTSAFLRGSTFDGQAIEGSDSISTAGCK